MAGKQQTYLRALAARPIVVASLAASALAMLFGCAPSSARAPAPPVSSAIDVEKAVGMKGAAGDPTDRGSGPSPSLSGAPGHIELSAGDPEPLPSAAPAAPPTPVVVIEPIYKYGLSSPLDDVAAFNRGELGEVVGALPDGPKHPLPRVMIEVTSSRGGLTSKTVERDVRGASWHATVSCYRLDAYRDAELELDATLALEIHRSGSIRSARVVEAKTPAKRSGASSAERAAPMATPCLAKRIAALSLSGAKSGTSARVRFRVWPGDDPLAPPDDLVVPGPGEMDPEVARDAVVAALPALEACHRTARTYAPDLWGRLAVRVHVDDGGRVDEAFEVESSFPDDHLERCALRALRSVAFPPPRGGDMRIVVPLRFLPQGVATGP